MMGSLVPRLMVPVALRLADIPLDRKARRDRGSGVCWDPGG
ncbi:MAG: hypothetical protein ACLT5P_17700 [Flavonifractor plautii]